jgi:hypothetical protein
VSEARAGRFAGVFVRRSNGRSGATSGSVVQEIVVFLDLVESVAVAIGDDHEDFMGCVKCVG